MEKHRIMIVEDEGIIAMQIQTILEQRGCEITAVCSSGEEALKRIEQARPNLVLMDMKLQGAMDGIAAAGLIRKQHDVPVIFLTAHSEDRTIEQARAALPYGYLLKPFNAQELWVAVEIALYKHESDREKDKLTKELQAALDKVKLLSGLLPICYSCKRIRNDEGYWIQIEEYIRDHSEAEFSHGLCKECAQKLFPQFYRDKYEDKDNEK